MNYIDEIIDKSVNKKIISVDIFDTLLLRNGQSEETRFFQSASLFKKSSPTVKHSVNSIFKARYHAHHTLYKLYKQGVLTEPNIESILSYQLDLLHDDTASLDSLLSAEISTELAALTINESLLTTLKELSKKSQIVLLSDMYLSSEFIKNIIKLKRIDLDFDLFVSNELNKSKHMGDAYPWLISKYKVDYTDVLHIGDNYDSDIVLANNLSIDTVFTPRTAFFYSKESALKIISNFKLRKQLHAR